MLRVVRQVTVELVVPTKLDGQVAVGGQIQQQPGGAFEVGHHHVEGRGDIGGGGAIDGAAVQQGLHAPCSKKFSVLGSFFFRLRFYCFLQIFCKITYRYFRNFWHKNIYVDIFTFFGVS